jgi:O-acetyl-ADP-ribose deacetylase (regulator of RNase III)
VGPIWRGGTDGEEKILAGCYRKSLELALENGVKTIAFPSISTGVYNYPIELAARVAVRNVSKFIEETGSDIEVIFCCFSASDLKVYKSILKT